jgi:hypothetical protein
MYLKGGYPGCFSFVSDDGEEVLLCLLERPSPYFFSVCFFTCWEHAISF